MKKLFTCIMAALIFFMPLRFASAEETISVDATSAILYNPVTKELLYEKSADKVLAPASLTKVMTLLVVSEEMKKRGTDPNTLVTISENAWKTSGSVMFLNVGVQVPISELIKGLAIVSGNDAAVALAEYFYGTTDKFVDVMNQRAKELGMKNTHFTTVHGLSKPKDGDKTTARDLLLLTDYYMSTFPENMKIHQTPSYVTKKEYHGGREDIEQSTRNPLLGSYEGGTGLKTGMIENTFNLIGTATRGDISLISVILGAKTSEKRTKSVVNLLDYGFNQYETVVFGKADEEMKTVKVFKSSDTKSTSLYLKQDASIVINKKDREHIKVKDTYPAYLEGGYHANEKVGERVLTVNDTTYTFDIIVKNDIQEASWFIKLLDQLAIYFNNFIESL